MKQSNMTTKLQAKPKTMLVRIYPPNKRLGHVAESYTLSGSGYPKFTWDRGWYEVDLNTARKLERARNNPMDTSSKPVFQVCTREEAQSLDIAEKHVKAEADSPIPLPRKVHAPDKAEVLEKSEPKPLDEDMDLSDDDNDEDWDALVEEESEETASDDDLSDLDDLVSPEKTVEKTVKKTVKKTTRGK